MLYATELRRLVQADGSLADREIDYLKTLNRCVRCAVYHKPSV